MEMTASPEITTPRSSRWSSVSSSERSSFESGMGEAVRRPGAGQRNGHAIGGVARLEIAAQLFQARLFVAVDEHVDLREGAAALLARLRHGVAGQLVEHGALDLADHSLLRLARGALL